MAPHGPDSFPHSSGRLMLDFIHGKCRTSLHPDLHCSSSQNCQAMPFCATRSSWPSAYEPCSPDLQHDFPPRSLHFPCVGLSGSYHQVTMNPWRRFKVVPSSRPPLPSKLTIPVGQPKGGGGGLSSPFGGSTYPKFRARLQPHNAPQS